jgi:tryptophan 2,3-dioxygenase
MSDAAIIRQLNSLRLDSLIVEQHKNGRMNLPASFLKEWREMYHYAKALLENQRRGLLVRKMARLLFEIALSLATVNEDGRPNYYQYTNARLLDWFLSPELKTLTELKVQARVGIFVMLQDLLEFEARTLGGLEQNLLVNFDKISAHKRQDAIADAMKVMLASVSGPSIQEVMHFENLEQYAKQPSRLSAVVHFSCMPLTQNHDEVVFIRVLHASELCFYGIRLCLTVAIEAIKARQMIVASRELKDAASIARLLHKVLQVLLTMPVEHFAQFRDLTGKASAIQSMSYHLMDIFLRGVNTEKAEHFKAVEQLKPLLRYAHPKFMSLRTCLDYLAEMSSEWSDVYAAARELDTHLLTWRGLHLGFAKRYIPFGQGGTGGTTGASYLQKHLKMGLFAETEPDYSLIQEMFPELELPGTARVATGITVAPPPEIISAKA